VVLLQVHGERVRVEIVELDVAVPSHHSASASSTGARASATRRTSTSATTMCREMDMRFWLEKAEAEVAELR
jgi:hypothetical protein